MKHLIDNDTIIKLASYDLLHEARQLIVGQGSVIQVLGTVLYFIRDSKQFRHSDCDAMKSRALPFIEKCEKLPFSGFTDDVAQINDPLIDQGEKILLSACASLDQFDILTGDRKFIKALAVHPNAELVRLRVAGRIVCLEQTILEISETFGYDVVFNKMAASIRQTDEVIDAIFGSNNESKIRVELKKRIHDLRKKSGALLK